MFGSLRSEHIDLSRTSAIGVAHLKQFLDFATHGARAFARAATGPLGDHESPFEAAVAERLSAKGWVLHPQIGVSGFRIDLGVVDPDASGAFLAGIECDGATYHRGATARDRDRLRQVVLEGLGWRILRIGRLIGGRMRLANAIGCMRLCRRRLPRSVPRPLFPTLTILLRFSRKMKGRQCTMWRTTKLQRPRSNSRDSLLRCPKITPARTRRISTRMSIGKPCAPSY